MNIQERKRKEEKRIRSEEKKIDDLVSSFYAVLDKHVQEIIVDENFDYSNLLSNDVALIKNKCKIFKDKTESSHKNKYYCLNKIVFKVGKKIQLGKEVSENIFSVLWGMLREISISYSDCLLFRNDKNADTIIDINKNYSSSLPEEFWKSPSDFIEDLNEIERKGEFPYTIEDLFDSPYDVTRVKRYENLVFKRVELDKVVYAEEEIDEAKRIEQLVESWNGGRFVVQHFLGSVYDKGNIYLVSEYVKDSQNLWDLGIWKDEDEVKEAFEYLREQLRKEHTDLAPRNVLATYDPNLKLTLIDFETHKKPKRHKRKKAKQAVFNNEYDYVRNLQRIGNNIIFEAKEDGKGFYVIDGKETKKYDYVRDLQRIDGKIAFKAREDGKEFYVIDGKETKRYDRVRGLRSIDGKIDFGAEEDGKEFFVRDGKETKSYKWFLGELLSKRLRMKVS